MTANNLGGILAELVGYAAVVATLLSCYQKTAIPLRVLAMVANLFSIAYAASHGIIPSLIQNCILLPLNLYRLVDVVMLLRKVRTAAKGNLSVAWLKPYMKKVVFEAGTTVFRKGEIADKVYCVISGTVTIPEIGHRLSPGDFIGEIAMFSPDRLRTMSVVCETEAEMLWITEDELAHLCYQKPEISFYLLRLITSRMAENVNRTAQAAIAGGEAAGPEAKRADAEPAPALNSG